MLLVQNDAKPDIIFQMKYDNGDSIDVSNETTVVTFYFKKIKCLDCEEKSGDIEMPPLNDGTDGKVKLVWESDSLDTTGHFQYEVEVNFNGLKMTFPHYTDFFVREKIA
jgi:hypothetical protein